VYTPAAMPMTPRRHTRQEHGGRMDVLVREGSLPALRGEEEEMRGLIDLMNGEIIAAPTADNV